MSPVQAAGFSACGLLRFGTCFSWACLLLGHLVWAEELKAAAPWEHASARRRQLVQTPQDSPGGQEVGAGSSRASSSVSVQQKQVQLSHF